MNPQHRGLPEPDCATERRIYPAGRRVALGLPDKSGVPVVLSGSAHWHRESLSCQGALALPDDLLDPRLQLLPGCRSAPAN